MHRITSRWASVFLALVVSLPAAAQLPDFTELVEKNGPSVVNVQAIYNAEQPMRRYGPGRPGEVPDEEVPEIFRRFFENPNQPSVPRDRMSMGSGFIISDDGYMLTNRHVVDGADSIVVRLSDRRELEATVIGSDAQTDVALLKLDAKGLSPASIGDSATLKPGQWVVAIGSPFNFDHSVTAGIVSATGRSFDASQRYVPFIQTDVAINRGNSGGPLIDLDGRVVGINSQILSSTGGYMGVSFAIPIEVAMSVVGQLKEKGFVSRGMLGVVVQEVNRDLALGLDLPRVGGALVNQVNPGSGAAKAGIKVGDVLLAFNGRELVRSSDLPPLVGAVKPGSQATLEVFRDGETLTVPITVGELEQDPVDVASAKTTLKQAGNPLGLVVDDLSAEQRQELGLGAGEGVVVSGVVGAPAARAALAVGDIVLMIGKKKVKSAAEFNAEASAVAPGSSVMLLVRRREGTSFISISVPKAKG